MPPRRDAAGLVTAEDALARLGGVRRQTLYAYVSRGLVRSEPVPGDPHRSLYDARDLERLADRRRRGRARRDVAASAIDFGEPVLASAITRIADDGPCYRGRDALALAASASLEEAAGVLWAGPCPVAPPTGAAPRFPSGLAPRERCLFALAREAAAAVGASAFATPPVGAAGFEEGARLLRRVAEAAAGARAPGLPIHALFARAWGLGPAGADLVRRALVLSADHELNASAFAVRVVASTGASLAACVLGGLAALSGPRHGGDTDRVRALLGERGVFRDPGRVLAARLARGERLSGFGHRLYPGGDPRAADLLAALEAALGADRRLSRLVGAAEELAGLRPNVDLPMVALERRLGLPTGAAGGIFAAGRAAGWIAHALEQRGDGRLIRPRAHYVGS